MTASNSSGVNGTANGAQPHSSSRRLPDTSRPLAFRDALPYYPQTSTLPFLPELIPTPKLESGSPALSTLDVLPPTDLQKLDDEARAQGHLTKEGKKTVDGVLHSLKASAGRSKYKFAPVSCTPSTEPPSRSLSQGLSPCTKAIFDKVGGFFVDKTSSAVVNGTNKVKPSPATPTAPPSINQISNINAHRTNSTRIEVAIPSRNFDPSVYTDLASQPMHTDPSITVPVQQLPPRSLAANLEPGTPTQTGDFDVHTPEQQQAGFRIELPSTKINRHEYMDVDAHLEEPQSLSRKRERHNILGDQTLTGESLDQRQRADAAVNELRRRVETIKRATRAAYEMEPGFDNIVMLNQDQEPTMTAEEHKKMLTTLQKVVSFGRFSTVPVEDLTQVLRLSEASLKEATSLEVQIDKEWDDVSVSNWLQQVSGMDTALKAVRTSLRIITGGREDRQLYSESIIENGIRVFQKAADEILIPLVELRNSGDTGSLFKMLTKHRKDISSVFVTCQKLLSMLAELVIKVPVTDLPLNTLEFVASNLVFVENAQYEKDSIAGIQKFDGIRSGAMDVLCQIFLIKPEQRQGILNEILTSLSKLPVTKQGSRQFKLAEGGNIQPVSALMMRLVQASSASPNTDKEGRRLNMLRNIDGADEDERPNQGRSTGSATVTSDQQAADQPDVAVQDLAAVLSPLADDAVANANMVINFLVQRAIGSSKTGETPYRNLLDLCVEDFTTCMDSPDWPAAELLLRCLMSHMIYQFEGERTAAPTKNMALEILGNLSSAISRLRSHTKRLAVSLQTSEVSELSNFLADLATSLLDSPARNWQFLAWTGPFRVVLESSLSRAKSDPHLESAASCTMTTWATRVRGQFENAADDDEKRDQELGRLAFRLRMMIEDRTWLTSQFEFNAVSPAQEKLSYATILLGAPLCEAFSIMLNILLKSMTSDQATVRSKSLKSVSHVLDTDPSILDRDPAVIERIRECAVDPSTQVRESALSLLGTCMGLRPDLEPALVTTVLGRFTDAGVMVRKRAIKLARDIYLRNDGKTLRTQISAALLKRVSQDSDESTRESARQTVEEIWFTPFYRLDDSAASQTAVADHAMLIIRTAKLGGLEGVLDQVFKTMLKPGATGPYSVCSKLVSNLFGHMSDSTAEDPDLPCGSDALRVLTIFARAEPKLFTFEQIRLLKPMVQSEDIKNTEDEDILGPFKDTMIILQHVLPQLSSVHSDFIKEIRGTLVRSMGSMAHRPTLIEMAKCQRVVCDLVQDQRPMVRLARSCLGGVLKSAQPPPGAPRPKDSSGVTILKTDKEVQRLKAYANLAATVYRFFDLESEIEDIRAGVPNLPGESVARMMINAIEPWVSPKQLLQVQQWTLDSIGAICQASPRSYTIPKVWALFQQVFKDGEPMLQESVLTSLKEFLTTEEKRSETRAEMGEAKSLTVMGGTNYDDVASATTQRFLKDIARIALASQDKLALTAVQVLGSINRQGLTHPKEIGVTLITLETSENKAISEIAFREHKLLHGKHESTMEREYSKAVQSAYEYQRDVVNETRGAFIDSNDPRFWIDKEPRAKLHNMIDVLKISKMKNRQRLFEKLIALVDFDPSTLETSSELPTHLDFTRFIMENLAFVEYQTIGELQTAVHKMENLATSIGTGIAQAIDSEVFGVRVDSNLEQQQLPHQELNDNDPVQRQIHQQLQGEAPGADDSEPQITIDDDRLRRLAVAANVLLIVWETRSYLRKLYNMGTSRQDGKAKAMAKDLNKSPTKAQTITGEHYWSQTSSLFNSLSSRENSIVVCKHFTDLMNYDHEVKVSHGGEEDDDMEMDPATPSDGGGNDDAPDGRGRKRKNNSTPGGRKKRQRSTSQPQKRGRPRKNLDPGADEDSDMEWA